MHYTKEHQFGLIQSLQMGVSYFGPPPVQVHAFLIDGLLIDTGPPKLSYEITEWLKTKNIQQVFITHHHEDHSGNVNEISEEFGVPIYGSKSCSDLVKGKVDTSLPQKIFWGIPKYTDQVLPYNGNQLKTQNNSFELIHIPGHAEDQMALYEAHEGWLFSADAFVSPVIKYFMKKESMNDQINSLTKLLSLDFDLLLCCHTPIRKGGKKILERKRNFLEEYYQQVVYYHSKGQSPREILKSMNHKENWFQYFFSGGNMCAINMVNAVLNDEAKKS